MAPKKAERLKEQLLRKDAPASEAVYFTTGCTLLDLSIGGGAGMGFRGGTLVNLVAVEGAGKTQLAAECIAHNFHKRKDKAFWHEYLDREHRFSFDTEGMWGVTVCDKAKECPDTIEEWDGHLGNLLEAHSTPGIVVTDSLDAFSTEETEARADQREGQVKRGDDIKQDGSYTISTGTPKFLSETLRIRMAQAAKSNSLILLLSQVRTKLGAMAFDPNKLQRNGGKALDHWCNDIIWLKVVRYITVGDKKSGTERKIGAVVKAWGQKSSSARPYREVFYSILFAYGIDNVGSNLDFLYNLRDYEGQNIGDLNKNAQAIRWDGGEEYTLAAAKRWLEANGGEGLDLLGDYQAHLKDCTGSRTFQIGELLDKWLEGNHPELYAKFTANFYPATHDREALIAKIEADSDLEAELTRRVIAKWEAIEAAAMPVRKPKFGGAA